MKRLLFILVLTLVVVMPFTAMALTVSSPVDIISGGKVVDEMSATRMTDTTMLVVYRIYSGGYTSEVALFTYSSGSWSLTDTEYLESGGASTDNHSVMRLSDTTAVVAYRRSTGKAVLVTISAGVLTVGTPVNLLSSPTDNTYISSAGLTSSVGVIAFRDVGDSNKGKAVVASVSGGVLSISAMTYIQSGGVAAYFTGVARISDTEAMIAVSDTGDSYKGKAVVATVSSGILSMSGTTNFLSSGGGCYAFTMVPMTGTTVIIAFSDNDDSNYGKAVIATVSGGGITMSSPTYLMSGGGMNFEISGGRLTDSIAIIGFNDHTAGKGKVLSATISGGSLVMSDTTYLLSGATAIRFTRSVGLTSTTGVVHFQDRADSDKTKFVGISTGYAHKIYGVIPKKVYGVTPVKINGI